MKPSESYSSTGRQMPSTSARRNSSNAAHASAVLRDCAGGLPPPAQEVAQHGGAVLPREAHSRTVIHWPGSRWSILTGRSRRGATVPLDLAAVLLAREPALDGALGRAGGPPPAGGGAIARATSAASRRAAASRLRSWERNSDAVTVTHPVDQPLAQAFRRPRLEHRREDARPRRSQDSSTRLSVVFTP